MEGKSPFAKIDQIGVVVKDLEIATRYYQSLGIGPFEPLMKLAYTKREAFGKPVAPESIKLKVGIAQMGPVQLELIQPIEGQSPWMEFLHTRGEGIIHLCLFVDDIEKEETRLADKKLKVVYRSRYAGGGGATVFDTSKPGGVLLELCQWPKGA